MEAKRDDKLWVCEGECGGGGDGLKPRTGGGAAGFVAQDCEKGVGGGCEGEGFNAEGGEMDVEEVLELDPGGGWVGEDVKEGKGVCGERDGEFLAVEREFDGGSGC